MLAFARHAAAEMDVCQHRDAGFTQQALPEFLGIGGTDPAAGFGDVGPDVERAAGHLALHAGNLIQ